jgi:hypothetical protein
MNLVQTEYSEPGSVHPGEVYLSEAGPVTQQQGLSAPVAAPKSAQASEVRHAGRTGGPAGSDRWIDLWLHDQPAPSTTNASGRVASGNAANEETHWSRSSRVMQTGADAAVRADAGPVQEPQLTTSHGQRQGRHLCGRSNVPLGVEGFKLSEPVRLSVSTSLQHGGCDRGRLDSVHAHEAPPGQPPSHGSCR